MGRLRRLESLLAAAGQAYLVGSGSWPGLRVVADQDYVTGGDPAALARSVAQRMRGRAFLMDEERQHWRIVAPRLPVVDLAPLAGGDIGLDLSRRDFTINAVATMLPDHRPVLDPFCGLPDLRHGLIRQVSSQAMSADPVRVLRGLRLASEHGFVIESETLQAMCRAAPGLQRVKPERIRAEVLRALEAPGWYQAAMTAQRMGVWAGLPIKPRLDPGAAALSADLRRLLDLEPLVLQASRHLGGIPGLAEPRARAVAVLAAVLRASDRDPQEARLGRQLRLSAREAGALAGMYRSSIEALAIDAPGLGPVYDLIERHGAAGAWGAGLAGAGAMLAAVLRLEVSPLDRLPNGRRIAEALSRPAGPWLGPLIRRLRRAVATGEVCAAEALETAAEWMHTENARGGAADEE